MRKNRKLKDKIKILKLRTVQIRIVRKKMRLVKKKMAMVKKKIRKKRLETERSNPYFKRHTS